MARSTGSEELARGAVLVLFGVTVLVVPSGFLSVVLRVFGLVALVDGALAFVGLHRSTAETGRSNWRLGVEAIAGIAAGGMTVLWPGITAFVLYTILGAWMFLTGAAEFISALGGRSEGGGKALGVLRGVLGLGFGLLLLAHPITSAATPVGAIGFYAVAAGVTTIAAGVSSRRLSPRASSR